jgi:PDDEXK-like domain of unknown function (DUF3799)
MLIDHPGTYAIPAAEYHADPCIEPSLSSSIVKMLCLDSALHAQHEHPRLNPAVEREEADHFDLGLAVHDVLLEGGGAVEPIDAPDWRTKAAKEARAAARAAGKIPLLAKQCTDVIAMTAALRVQLDRHTDGGAAMFTSGEAELTAVWIERDESGAGADVWCRARFDWLRTDPYAIDDYKSTSGSANPDSWARTMFSAGHDVQAAWYLRGLRAITGEALTDPATFRFCVQETYAPFAVSVIALNPDALLLAEKKCLYAIEQWREARASNDWRGYPRRTAFAVLPPAHEAWWLEKELR